MWWKLSTLTISSFLVANFPFVPTRPAIMAVYFAKDINFILVTLACVLGTTLGVIPSYGISYKARDLEKVKKWLRKKWVQKFLNPIRHNIFLIIIIINITPLPDILVGVLGGSEKYDFKKFLLANFIGRVIFYLPFALIGHVFSGDINHFQNWLISYFSGLIG